MTQFRTAHTGIQNKMKHSAHTNNKGWKEGPKSLLFYYYVRLVMLYWEERPLTLVLSVFTVVCVVRVSVKFSSRSSQLRPELSYVQWTWKYSLLGVHLSVITTAKIFQL